MLYLHTEYCMNWFVSYTSKLIEYWSIVIPWCRREPSRIAAAELLFRNFRLSLLLKHLDS